MQNNTKHYRFFVPHESIIRSSFISKDKPLLNQIVNVFRLKKGAKISIFDGSGYEYLVEIVKLKKDLIEGEIISKQFKKKDSDIKVSVFCPILKGSHFDLVLQKCTELGASAFYPVVYQNSVVKVSGKKERWEKIAREASEQCGRIDSPVIWDSISFEEALSHLDGRDMANIVADHDSDIRFRDIAKIIRHGGKGMNVFIGPEGGFSPGEMKKMQDKKCLFLNLGENTLRAETACILAVGILSNI